MFAVVEDIVMENWQTKPSQMNKPRLGYSRFSDLVHSISTRALFDQNDQTLEAMLDYVGRDPVCCLGKEYAEG